VLTRGFYFSCRFMVVRSIDRKPRVLVEHVDSWVGAFVVDVTTELQVGTGE